jgi:hypothetical protein
VSSVRRARIPGTFGSPSCDACGGLVALGQTRWRLAAPVWLWPEHDPDALVVSIMVTRVICFACADRYRRAGVSAEALERVEEAT